MPYLEKLRARKLSTGIAARYLLKLLGVCILTGRFIHFQFLSASATLSFFRAPNIWGPCFLCCRYPVMLRWLLVQRLAPLRGCGRQK